MQERRLLQIVYIHQDVWPSDAQILSYTVPLLNCLVPPIITCRFSFLTDAVVKDNNLCCECKHMCLLGQLTEPPLYYHTAHHGLYILRHRKDRDRIPGSCHDGRHLWPYFFFVNTKVMDMKSLLPIPLTSILNSIIRIGDRIIHGLTGPDLQRLCNRGR